MSEWLRDSEEDERSLWSLAEFEQLVAKGEEIVPGLELRWGIHSQEQRGQRSFCGSILGYYGLEKIASTGEGLALCGFSLAPDKFVIEHTPQGKRPELFTGQAKKELAESNFRQEMMGEMEQIAVKLGYSLIEGVPAALLPSVELGLVKYEDAFRVVDRVYKQCGFELNGSKYEKRLG